MASDKGLDRSIRKVEKTSLQKFKNQNRVVKKFGSTGLKVYRAIRKSSISMAELMEKTGLGKEKLAEMLAFMEEKGMIEAAEGEAAPEEEEETGKAKPEGLIGKEEKEEPIEEEAAKEKPPEEEEHEEPPMAPEGEIVPEEEEPIEEEAAKEKPPEEEASEEVIPLEMEGEEEGSEEEPSEEEEYVEEEEEFLTAGERKIKEKYGQQGLDVYNLIDGQRTAEEIMKKTGISEGKLIEMLGFMEKEGIIKLEHPGGKRPSAPPRPPAAREEGGFAPMIEGTAGGGAPHEAHVAEGPEFVLDVPAKSASNMIKEIQLKAALMIKYGQAGVKAMESINGQRDAVEISVISGIPLYTVYEILAILKREGLISLKPSSREEIRKKYGEDGYSVYKRYGREGVMLYQLIGKEIDLKEMAARTSKDNRRVVEIFMFIHKLLGIDLPIDEEVLLQRLSASPAPKK